VRSLVALLTLLISVALNAQTTSTLCGTEEVRVFSTVDLRLMGCGEGFANNLLWHLDRADSRDGSLDKSVTRRATGKGAVVYLFEGGIMSRHDELMRSDGSVVIGYIAVNGLGTDCPAGRNSALDPCFTNDIELAIFTHGTATASMVAGKNTGIAPDAKIVSVYMESVGLDIPGWIRTFDAIIKHAYDPTTPQFKTGIISMSFVPNYASVRDPNFPAFEKKMREMIAGVDANGNPEPTGRKFLFVTIAGNFVTGTGNQCDSAMKSNLFPGVLGGSIDGLITVGGVDETNHLWDRSCRGSAVDILAPAADLFLASASAADHYRGVSIPFGLYPLNSGTSYAAPYVSGMAALLLEKNPDLTPVELEQMIKTKSSHVANSDEVTAGGRVAVFDWIFAVPGRRAGRR
jgi:subtilisin family serine protease